jgi:hypothetical protein
MEGAGHSKTFHQNVQNPEDGVSRRGQGARRASGLAQIDDEGIKLVLTLVRIES